MKFTYRFLRVAVILLTMFLVFPALSQEKMTFGKIDPADLALTRCPFDTTADAMVLGDVGSTRFEYDLEKGFFMIFERLLRIKIFTKNGYRHGDQSITLYHTERNKELLSVFRARTYNMEGGKLVETKVKDESIFTEEVDNYRETTRFTFPALKEGSVIEMKYTIRSQFYQDFRDWFFQGDIPVRWSDYSVCIPEFYHYARQTYGYIPFCINKEWSNTNSVNLYSNSASVVSFTENNLRIAARNVPAMKDEPYTNTINNYISRIEFVLHSYQFPNQVYHKVNASWDQIAVDLLEDEDFGNQLNKKGVAKDLALSISAEGKTPFDEMLLAFNRLRNMMKWNEKYSFYTSKRLAKTLEEKTGNSADINLLLVALMRELGLKADPVLLSTRNHGMVVSYNVSLYRMNHVICLVTIDNKEYMLDATQRLLPYTMLPYQCLNGQGMVVLPDHVRWVNLLTGEKNTKIYYSNIKIESSGDYSGDMQISQSGYLARDSRNSYNLNGKDEYIKALKNKQKNWDIEEVTFGNLDSLTEPVVIKYTFRNSEPEPGNSSLIYLNVFANMVRADNDFTQVSRDTPVDFGCPMKESCYFTFEIPEGYQVESLPENARILLPEEAGSYRFVINQEGRKIIVNTQLSVNQILFLPGDYATLRNFFTQILAKQAEQIVLRKA